MKVITRSGIHENLYEIEVICTTSETMITLAVGEEISAKHLEIIHKLMRISYNAGLNQEDITMLDGPLNQ